MLDVVCIIGVIALGAIVALIGKGVERLSPADGSVQREAARGGERG